MHSNNIDSTSLALQLNDVHLCLPLEDASKINILKGINLELAKGVKLGLVGPSGSGKTSLLTLIAGLQHPTSGDIKLFNQSFAELSEEELSTFRRENIGIIFQNFHLLPTMTALENVALPLEIASAAGVEQAAAEALEMVGLGHRLHHFPHQLSGGEQQRTAIARAFVDKPKLILADEPTGNLDSEMSETVMKLLIKLTEATEANILFITHDLSLLNYFDSIVKMKDGLLSEPQPV